MGLGNDTINKLDFNRFSKFYKASADDINIEDENNSISIIINNIGDSARVLDVGCSYGYVGEWLVKNKSCEVYGIDINIDAINYVKGLGYYKDAFCIDLDNINDLGNDISKLDKKFDYIICADVLEHLKNPTKALLFLCQLLDFGGQILVSMPDVSNIDIILNLIEGRFNYSELGILDNTHLRFYTKNSFISWIDTINDAIDKYKLDIKFIKNTNYTSDFIANIKNKSEWVFKLFAENISDLYTLQNIFILTKINPHAVTSSKASEAKKSNSLSKLNDYLCNNMTCNNICLNRVIPEGNIQIFWTREHEFNENCSIIIPFNYNNNYVDYEIELPIGAYGNIRIDLGSEISYMKLREISIKTKKDEYKYNISNNFEGLNFINIITNALNEEENIVIPINNDPQIVVDRHIENFEDSTVKISIKVKKVQQTYEDFIGFIFNYINVLAVSVSSVEDSLKSVEIELESVLMSINAKDEEISKLDNIKKAKDEEILKRDNIIKTRDEEISEQDNIIKTKDEEILKQQQFVYELQNSTSWKITKPFRYIGKAIKRIFRMER